MKRGQTDKRTLRLRTDSLTKTFKGFRKPKALVKEAPKNIHEICYNPYNPGICKKIGSCVKRNIGESLIKFEAIGAKSKNVTNLKIENRQSLEKKGVVDVLPCWRSLGKIWYILQT